MTLQPDDFFTCDQCSFRSKWKSNLRAHKIVHTNEKLYCSDCNFKQRQEKKRAQEITGLELKLKINDNAKQREKKKRVQENTGSEERLELEVIDDVKDMPDQEKSSSCAKQYIFD